MTKAQGESNLVVQGLLGYLSAHGKTDLLSSVANLLEEVVDKTKNAQEIVVVSPISLTQRELKEIDRIISHFLKRTLPVVNKLDKNLLGGFTIRVGDFFLNASLSNELKAAKHLLLS